MCKVAHRSARWWYWSRFLVPASSQPRRCSCQSHRCAHDWSASLSFSFSGDAKNGKDSRRGGKEDKTEGETGTMSVSHKAADSLELWLPLITGALVYWHWINACVGSTHVLHRSCKAGVKTRHLWFCTTCLVEQQVFYHTTPRKILSANKGR